MYEQESFNDNDMDSSEDEGDEPGPSADAVHDDEGEEFEEQSEGALDSDAEDSEEDYSDEEGHSQHQQHDNEGDDDFEDEDDMEPQVDTSMQDADDKDNDGFVEGFKGKKGKLSVRSYGSILYDLDGYHTTDCIYPVGFKCNRSFASASVPGSSVVYHLEIQYRGAGAGPRFLVYAGADQFEGKSPNDVWSKVA
eukprot:CAMPEP_0113684592 /NCGR_PEP_ID=MMETSP0038_2-20120614/14102_1 /TAXON_ID=2898 /ORGANISM="Cryptomonas paramecium" /LENGTH=193 /DNA_ID=CAMNT_0000604385 /DNA_START=38 /DNA_END=616 /DNA_ORIENTATION=- /assembly_acc=CAM_ASM_000170